MSDLTSSPHQRQNILNNRYALQAAEQHLALGGTHFEGATVFTKQQVVALFNDARLGREESAATLKRSGRSRSHSSQKIR